MTRIATHWHVQTQTCAPTRRANPASFRMILNPCCHIRCCHHAERVARNKQKSLTYLLTVSQWRLHRFHSSPSQSLNLSLSVTITRLNLRIDSDISPSFCSSELSKSITGFYIPFYCFAPAYKLSSHAGYLIRSALTGLAETVPSFCAPLVKDMISSWKDR